jgi:hypothetical protein
MKSLLSVLFAVIAATGCTRYHYEYEEEFHLNIDGSGQLRISGSQELLAALYEVSESSPPEVVVDDLRSLFDGPDLEVSSVSHASFGGRSFFHIRARFEDLKQLSRHSAFSGRRFWLGPEDEHMRFEADIPGRYGSSEKEPIHRDGVMVFLVHLPSPVRSHNSELEVKRGNIIGWEHEVADFFEGRPLQLEVVFDRRTVLATTFTILILAAGFVAVVVTGALIVLVRIGRRELARKADDAGSQERGRP